MKVMVAGDVEGNLTTLFKRVEAVDKKAGEAKNKKEPALNQDFQVLLRCFCVLAPFLGLATLGGQITKVEGSRFPSQSTSWGQMLRMSSYAILTS